LMDPKGGEPQQYDKIGLLPFAEYIPLEQNIPWSYIKIPDVSPYMQGKEFTVFQEPGFRFGATICWESIFPDLVRQFVKRGAQFIVNLTNEAWFGETAAPYQFLSMSVFRAVENRVFVVRCANTGISCFIDPLGRVVSRVQDGSGKDIFVRGVLTDKVVLMDSDTVYTRYGDVFAWLNMGVASVFLLLALLRPYLKKSRRNSRSPR
jgi:apolipoprotein N-acyltransferase